jgi:hypothetical protein
MPMMRQAFWRKHFIGMPPRVQTPLEDERVKPEDIEFGPGRRVMHQVFDPAPVHLLNPFPAFFQGPAMIGERETAHEFVQWRQSHHLANQ